MSYIQAVNAALAKELENPKTLVYGEDVGRAGGIFAASRNLQRQFGEERVFDTPIAESAILGSAVGAAMAGLRPIVEIMWADFLLVALDQLINQAANVRYVTAGKASAPLVVRTQQGSTPGSCAQHSQSLEALLAHIPGLRVALPATPQDAYSVLRAAAASDDPCIVIEARGLYGTKGPVVAHDAPGPIGKAVLRRKGPDGLVIAWGTMLAPALEAADILAREGRQVSVLDPVWLSPFDGEALAAALDATAGPVVIAHEANLTGGFGAEIGMRVLDHIGASGNRPIRRLGAPDIRMPAAPGLRAALLPDAAAIAAAFRAS
jgi:2-oxoisovalerate dehydrogenase E1 component